MGNYFDQFTKPQPGPGGVDMTKPLDPAVIDHMVAPPPPPEPEPGRGNFFDQYDPLTPEQKKRHDQITGGYSFVNPPKKSLWDRVGESASDMVQHYSPFALLSRAITRTVPINRDFDRLNAQAQGVDPSVFQDQTRGQVTANEREFRDMRALQDQGDPAWRPGAPVMDNLAREGANFLGGVAGGMISDPTNVIAPGETFLAKLLAQGAIGAGVDAATQGAEMGEGVRDQYDPWQTAISTAAGPALLGLGHAAGKIPVRGTARDIRTWWQDRGDTVAPEDLLPGSLDGPGLDVPTELASAGLRPEQFASPDEAAAIAQRIHAVRTQLPAVDLGAAEPIAPSPGPAEVPAVAAPAAVPSSDERLAALTGQLQRFSQDGPEGVPEFAPVGRAPDVPEVVQPRDPAPAAEGAGRHPHLDRMAEITEGSESGHRDVGADGKPLRSPKGAEGRMQVMPGTNVDPGFGVRPAADGSPAERARVGRDYLDAMMRRYDNDPAKAWAAYNWGPGNLDDAVKAHGAGWFDHAPAETRAYVEKNMHALGAAPPSSTAMGDVAAATRTERSSAVDASEPAPAEVHRSGMADQETSVARHAVDEAPPPATSHLTDVERTGLEAVTQRAPQGSADHVAASELLRNGEFWSQPGNQPLKRALVEHFLDPERAREPVGGPESASKGRPPHDSGEDGNRAPGAPGEPLEAIYRPEVPPETRAPVVGGTETVRTARGREAGTEFQVRELRDLVTSDHPAYDPALQPRDRGARASSDAQVAEIASRLDPEQLHSSRLASQGAPIIGQDRMVESGNGRVMALRRAYEQHPERVTAYQQMIRDRGMSTEGFEQPVLVRSRTGYMTDEGRQAFAREANERDTMGLSSTEQAKSDAGAMSHETLARYRGGAVTDSANRDFVRSWMDEVATPAERNQLIRGDGSISTDGIRRLRSSMLAKAFDDGDLVGKIVEDPDNGIRSIGNVLTDAAPEFAKIRQRVAAGELGKDFDISKNVGEMAQLISRARQEGKSALDLVGQRDIFQGETDPTTEALVRLMFKADDLKQPRSAADMAEGLRFYTQEAGKVSDGPSLLGEQHGKLAPADILKAATEKLDAKAAARAGDNGKRLFMRAKEDGLGWLRSSRGPLADELHRIGEVQTNPNTKALAAHLAPLVRDAELRHAPGMKRRGEAVLRKDGSAVAKVAKAGDTEAVLHESVHVATMSKYGQLLDNVDDPHAAAIIKDLQALRDRAEKSYRPAQDPGGHIKDALENTDELLAYGLTSPRFQKWLQARPAAGLWGRFVDGVRRILGLDPKYGSMLDRVLTRGADLIHEMGRERGGAATGEELVQHGPRDDDAGEAVKPDRGGFARLADLVVDVDGLKGDAGAVKAALGNPTTTLRRFITPMKRVVSAAMFTNDARLRGLAARFDSRAIEDYANVWHARAGKGDSTGRTYHEAVARASTTRTQRAYEALEPFLRNKASLSRIRDLLATPDKSVRASGEERAAARELRDLLKETIDYRKDAGEDVGEVTDGYYPRILKVEQVAKNRDEFLKQAAQLYRGLEVADPEEAARRWFGQIFDEYAGLDGGLQFARGSSGVGSTSAKAREFGKEADTLLRDFYDDDVFHVMASYFTGAAKRAEYARRFGKVGREGSAERHAWLKEHGDKTQLDVLMGRIKYDVRKSDQDPAGVLHVIDSVHASNLGQMGSKDPFTRNATSYLHTWNQLAKMDHTLVTSLGELTMGFIRGGPRYGFSYVKDSLQEMARLIRGAHPSDAQRWAEAIGVANDAMVNQTLTSRIDAEHATAGAQRILSGYYRAIGLHQFTEGERIAATTMGRKMVTTFAGDMASPRPRVRKRAELYLRELGVKDPEAFATALREQPPTREDVLTDKGVGAEFGTAILRVVNQTVMIPNRAEKPTWSAHPVGSLVFSLLGYSYGFKKNVLDRAGRLAVQGVKDADPKLLIPAFSLSLMAGFQALNDTYLRPALFGSGYDFSKETPMESFIRVIDRAGFTGGLSPIINAIKAVRYDRSLAESLSGPVIGSLFNAAQKIFVEPFTDRNSPNTNTAERNAAAAFYDTVVDPMIDAMAAARLKGVLRSAVVLGTGNRRGGALPGVKDDFVDETAGEEEPKDGEDQE